MANSALTNFKFVISYNGTSFHGLAPNPGVRTVVGEMSRVIEGRLGLVADFVMSGRTDAGVHATHQVLNCFLDWKSADALKLAAVVNAKLSPEVVVQSVEAIDAEFSSRYDATSRTYEYLIDASEFPDPFRSINHWHVPESLDIDAMNRAASALLGTHDFSSFCRKPKHAEDQPEPVMMREIKEISWSRPEYAYELIKFQVTGSAFCRQMVRAITGHCVAVGLGKRSADEMAEILEAKDRAKVAPIAPPHGLTLVRVDY